MAPLKQPGTAVSDYLCANVASVLFGAPLGLFLGGWWGAMALTFWGLLIARIVWRP
jgi:predicted MFS family arabinose efflux permease